NNASTSTSTVVRPEVSINLTMPANILVGDEFSSSLSYANSGSIAAANVTINTTLPVGVTLTRFIQNPSAACSYTAATRRIGCSFASLAAGTSGNVVFAAQANVTAAASIATTATISTATAGDTATNNTSTALTTVQFPNPSVTISLSPSPVPVGTSGTISAPYRNTGTGIARNAVLTITLPAGIVLGALPGGCSYTTATRALTCGLGDLAAGVSGTRAISFSLPATFPADQLDVSATISSTTPERSLDQANNTANTTTNVVRPNVFVTAAGPASIVGQGSAFWYTVSYGNQYHTNPALTRAAAGVVLQATLPPDVTLVQVDLPPSSVSGQTLSWNLGSLAANAGGQIHIVVQTHVPAGASLRFSANIATSTIGDDPSDNYATTDTTVVQPPSAVSQAAGSLRVAIHSDLDPNSQDNDALNGVYESAGSRITWPAGEVLDITPRLDGVDFPDEPLPFPYEYRARVVGWSIAGVNINGVTHNPQAVDSRGLAGCRAGAHPNTAPERLIGCAYAYLGGENRDAIDHPGPISESQLASQAHLYWTQPPAPRMRNDVYLFTLDPIEAVQLAIQVEIEVWIVNTAPGSIGGIALPEIPVVPLPDPERQLISQAISIDLLVPRSVIAPGS
ncbi:MAG: hypothetical protein HGA19_10570, partial [Oscillochloris sp.]|nr:hypothetical protein [Oscillochloris sp.]